MRSTLNISSERGRCCLLGQHADRVMRNVIHKEKPGRDAKQETEPEIAISRREIA